VALKVDDLQVFALIAQERSVSKAAALLYMAQQSLSQRIRSLEARVGQPLFIRSPRGMQLTEAGERLLPYAQRCTALLDEALEAARGERDRALRIQVHTPFAPSVAPVLGLALQHLEIDITHHHDVEELLERLLAGETDVAVAPITECPAELVMEPLLIEPLVCVTHPDAPLARMGRICLADLKDHPVEISLWHDEAGLTAGHRAPSTNGRQASAASPYPVWLCARSRALSQLADGKLVELTIVDLPSWGVQLNLAYRRAERDHAHIRALRSAIERSATPAA
jgi:DNA-binding transcriptional LysR family regulator